MRCPISNSLLSGPWISPELWYGGGRLRSPAVLDVLSAPLPFNYPPVIWQAPHGLRWDNHQCVCVCVLSRFLRVCLSAVISVSASVSLHFTSSQKRGCFCIVCFTFLFLSLLLVSLKVSPRSLARSHLTSCCTCRNTHWQNESRATNSKSKHFVLFSSLLLFNPVFYLSLLITLFPLQLPLALSFPIILSCYPNHCPRVFSFYLYLLPLPPLPHFCLCEAGWLSVLTWEGLTFRGRSPACSTDISARLWWCLWTEMCGGKSCLSLRLPAALALLLHYSDWDAL